MDHHHHRSVLLLYCAGVLLTSLVTLALAQETIFQLYMPDAHLGQLDHYMKSVQPLPNDKTYFIVEFQPSATMEIVHHMEVDICLNGTINEGHPTCSDSHIIYMWAKNATKLTLPKGVGFKVGRNTPTQYLMLTMHFASTPDKNNEMTKKLGVDLILTDNSLSKTAGVFLLLTGGEILPGMREHFDVACELKEDVEMHVFAFRTHTHALGKVVSGYRVTRKHGDEHWTLIGKKNPQEPQMFYPVKHGEEITLKKGDIMAARCAMENRNTHIVSIGSTSKDEMCNFYAMYWVKGDHHPNQRSCFSQGPPDYYWEDDALLTNIPQGTDQVDTQSHVPSHVM